MRESKRLTFGNKRNKYYLSSVFQFMKRRWPMKLSARNVLKGRVKKLVHGAVNSEVTIVLTGGAELVSIIIKTSAKNLKLAKGKTVYAVIKASNVMIGVD